MSLISLLKKMVISSAEVAKNSIDDSQSYKNKYKTYSDKKLLELCHKKKKKPFSNIVELTVILKLLNERGYGPEEIR